MNRPLMIIFFFFFSDLIIVTKCMFLDQPRLQTVDGHLFIFGAKDKNLTLLTSNKGYLNVNGINMVKAVNDAKRAAAAILNVKDNMISKLEDDIKLLGNSLDQVYQRLNVCETLTNSIPTTSNTGRVITLQRRVMKLERKVRGIIRNLTKNECQNDPCQNGGSCMDRYLDYECRCSEGWEGKSCERDINECARFSGTDLGCQNGATCVNKRGSYECICPSGWYGLHCTRKQNDCSSAPASELCGHGVCITQAVGTKGYSCICDQGWTTNGVSPACTVDVDECFIAPCSRNPPVTCHNIPGGFICGSCPPGYTGNGFLCTDINECLTQNGGCSVQPMVSCINTIGSSTCGPCPPGYAGDGRTCTYVGRCQVGNGGCHPNARCQEVGSSVTCQCLQGYSGIGFGINGCTAIPGVPSVSGNPCVPNPCKYGGRCTSFSTTNFTCICPVGYSGRTCNIPRNPCLSNPCRNGGTCVVRRSRFFICRCTPNFSGRFCDIERQRCGGVLQSNSGELQFPTPNARSTRYSNNLSCAWIITVNHSLVINVTFEQFDLESGTDCQYDWVQIHDGRTAGDHLIGKFCGNILPNNGTIITTSNNMYMWFKSDSSTNRMGFKLKWNATAPSCGGEVDASVHGTIKSPGSPGKYPPNRDCYWNVVAPFGKMIRFTFFEIDLETHQNCSYDYLFIHENLDVNSKVIGRYCNSSVPEPLDSYGNAALVHFHSDPAGSGRGFQIAYHPIPGYPGCGGLFTTRRGEIKPPTEDGKYVKNMDCVWIIRLQEDLKIKLNFRFIDLEQSTTCYADFVEVRDGGDIYAPLLGRYCGDQEPATITSNGNQLYIRFYADQSIQLRGFRIQYEGICGQSFTDDSGIIKSPGYPTTYRDSENCIFIIETTPGKAIDLDFQDFEFEYASSDFCYYDYLEIRDGHDSKSPLIGKFCGANKPAKIVSSHNYLWMKMVTDSSLSHRGFYANYTTIDVSCGGILKEPTGIIRTPTQSSEYPPNHYCRWVIVGKPGEVISLTFTSFKLEFDTHCSYDYVVVYDNSTVPSSGGLVGKFCGSQIPPQLTTTDSVMTVEFRSDASYSLEGFTASYAVLNASTVCGGNYYTSTGILKSPNYPRQYPPLKDCTWIIKVPYGRKVTLNIRDFDLEIPPLGISSRACYDSIEFRDGAYESSPLIGTYCDAFTTPKRITSQSNSIYIKFHSDSALSGRGFKLSWDSTVNGCGGTLSASSGAITSPNYPEPYGSNSDCTYKISVSSGSKVQLSFLDLELEDEEGCFFDFIQIFDGPDKTAKSLGKYCSSNNHPDTLLSTSNTMFILFRSDLLDARKGFYLKYRALCNTEIKGYQGIIESPDFPNTFTDPVDCNWVITAPRGNKINASFTNLQLGRNCNETYIEIKEGPIEGGPTNLIGKYCDKLPPNNLIASSLQKLYVHLVSNDYTPTNWGAAGNFRLEWVVNGCGGSFKRPSGTFTSPGHPDLYPPNTLCEWFITVDPTSSISLSITEINFEKATNCVMDSLEVFGGPDDTAPLLSRLCHSQQDEVKLESSGNQMYVRFQSDASAGGKGFSASYTTIKSRCGGRFLSNYGSIHSRDYPQNYGRNDDCIWTIKVDSTHRVNLTFLDFDILTDDDKSCTNNYVQVFDGESINSPSLLKHCGNMIPNPKNLFSTSNVMTVRLRSEAQLYTAKGFLANYSIACGAIITANEPGVIELNNHLNIVYENNNCSWIITSPEPDGHITLTLNQVDISDREDNETCDTNSLSVYDGVEKNSTLLGQFCGSRTPLPIVSRGNIVILRLRSMGFHQGFLKVTYSSASSACGGDLLSEIGQFATPNYPGSYPPKSECVWTIKSSPGNRVQINFKQFDIAVSPHCNQHYVEIRENDATGKILGVFCGTNSPSNLTAQNSVWIKFRSGQEGTGNLGFLADYNLVYGNELSGPTGQIANPGYPKPFIQYISSITWKITVDFGRIIQITFKKFHIDKHTQSCAMGSTLSIHDGVDATAPKLLEACGVLIPDPITSSSNVIFINFHNLPVVFGSLFLLEWNEIAKPWPNLGSIFPTPFIPGCGGFIDLTSPDNRSVIITSPGYPNGYMNGLNCTWIIECPEEEHLLLTVKKLDIASMPYCYSEYVTISSGINGMSNWEQKAKLCRNNETSTQYATSNFMNINFHSGYQKNRTGFSFTVERDCGGSIRKSNGIIDFNWNHVSKQNTAMRNWYDKDTSCEWDITVSPGRTIKATFTEFNITPFHDGTCVNKYIVLRNGGTKDSPLLGAGKYCSEPHDIPSTTSNRMFIKIKTPYQTSSFKLKFEEEAHNCGGHKYLSEEFNETIISSPNYPNIPPPKVECVWLFSTSSGHRLQIDFLERFDLSDSQDGCSIEYVELRDGGTQLSSEIGRYCREKPSTQKSSGNMLYLKYYTNATDPKNGFKARVSLARCGGIIRTNQGILTSPGYPNSYQYGLDCRWEIESDLRYKIKINFMDLDLPPRLRSSEEIIGIQRFPLYVRTRGSSRRFNNCSSSALIIISEPAPPESSNSLQSSYPHLSPELIRLLKPFLLGRDKDDTIIGKVCSNQTPEPIQSSAYRVIITFNSGAYINNPFFPIPRGFKLNITSSVGGCDYTINTASGVITSPNYPNEISSYYFCNWKITVPLGRRVTLTVDDIDLVGSVMEQRISIYNEHQYRTRFASITSVNAKIGAVYKSSSNLMMINYWSNTYSGDSHRGFRFTFNSDEPAICGGNISNDQGLITAPENETSFFCEWQFRQRWSENQTLSFFIFDSTISNRSGLCDSRYASVVSVASVADISDFDVNLCSNISSLTLRSPFTDVKLTAARSTYFGPMVFNVRYKLSPCGGAVYGTEATITSPSYPNSYAQDLDCAWLIKFPVGTKIKITIQDLQLEPSCSDYLTIKNGGSYDSPLLEEYCGTVKPNNFLISESSNVLVEFHSDSKNQGRGFKIIFEPDSNVCGGVIHSPTTEIMTPNFPSNYNNNQECEWEIRTLVGMHIGLTFVDRFHIEESTNCQNDFVKVFDYVNGNWKEIKTLCGREFPSPINSTSSKLKILFRSNADVTSDGFKAKWQPNCGGTFKNIESGTIISPGFPDNYPNDIHCIYNFDYGTEYIDFNFNVFQLEEGFRGSCRYDSLEFFERSTYSSMESVGKYCGSVKPNSRKLRSPVRIEFKSDKINSGTGFSIDFSHDGCGGYVNESKIIDYKPSDDYHGSQCIWEIVAPSGMVVIVRVLQAHITFYQNCIQGLSLYEGSLADNKLIGKVCGNLNKNLPVFRSTTNKLSIALPRYFFTVDSPTNFTAAVIFSYGPEQGCGGTLELGSNPELITSPDVNRDGLYEEFLDCSWLIMAKPFHYIIANFLSIDMDSCNVTTSCTCDFVELRDGMDSQSDLLVRACGKTPPPIVTSSGYAMQLRMATDGTYNAKGFQIQFSSQLSRCGYGTLKANESIQVLHSPNYPQNYPEGIRCKWIITTDEPLMSYYLRKGIHIHIENWDIEDSNDCSVDYLSIEDSAQSGTAYKINEGELTRNRSSNGTEVIRGKSTSKYISNYEKVVLCANGQSIDFYSKTSEVTIQFVSNSGITKKGFQLEYSHATCTRNFTSPWGRIKQALFKNDSHCYMTISAPSSNHTISLYFWTFYLQNFGDEGCAKSYLEVRDGPNVQSPLVGKFCGYSVPDPIFSSSQFLWLHIYTEKGTPTSSNAIDMTYLTTDQGKGCGGRIYADSGVITSPDFPKNYRQNSACRWDLLVPVNLVAELQFITFDIGSQNTCETDYIEIFDYDDTANLQTLVAKFCGNNRPAVIRTNTDATIIKYTTSIHNGGTGWKLRFKAVSKTP